jgi:hypothetical protein
MKDAKGVPVSATKCHDEFVDQTYSTSVKTNLDTKVFATYAIYKGDNLLSIDL